MNKILYKLTDGKPSFWLMRDVPEEPIKNNDKILSSMYWYQKAIHECKTNALEIINWQYIPIICGHNPTLNMVGFCQQDGTPINPGDIFPFPDSLEFKEEHEGFDWNARTVIRLIPKQKEESQDELWEEVQERLYSSEVAYHEDTNWLKSKFTISRKP